MLFSDEVIFKTIISQTFYFKNAKDSPYQKQYFPLIFLLLVIVYITHFISESLRCPEEAPEAEWKNIIMMATLLAMASLLSMDKSLILKGPTALETRLKFRRIFSFVWFFFFSQMEPLHVCGSHLLTCRFKG